MKGAPRPRSRPSAPAAARGRFLVLEGLDGAGTTTQTAELRRRLAARGLSVATTAEPSAGPIGALIRTVLSRRLQGAGGRPFDRGALALLFAADRLDHVASEVVPQLAAGRWVLSDRYLLSSLAYQALDLPADFVASANERAPKPDLTLFLAVPPEVALRRRRAERSEADLFEELPVQRRVAAHYEARIAEGRAGGAVLVVDGTQSLAVVADELERRVVRHFHLDARPKANARSEARKPSRRTV